VGKLTLQLHKGDSVFSEVLEEGQLLQIDKNKIGKNFPVEVREIINISTCAILPILSGDRAIGLVLVDNKHSGRPLSENMLTRLQTVLSYAGLVWETLRQQKKSESLLDANYQIMGEAGIHSLKETLRNICETARTITEADWALVYPLREEEEFIFDRENTAYAGQLAHSITIKEKPNPDGVSVHILKTGMLAINNIQDEEAKIRNKHISKNDFIKSEGVKAVLGIAIRDIQRNVLLGILYLDFRTPQHFAPTDEHRAKALASLAAVAISNARRFDEQRHRKRLEAAQTTAEAIGTELYLPQMFRQVLHRLHSFFKKTTLCILTYDEDENALKFAPSTLEFYKIQNPKFEGQNTFHLSGKSLACRAARKALKTKKSDPLNIADVRNVKDYLPLNPKTLSELCVPLLNSKQELLGVLVLERSQLHGFDDDDVALIETVARQLSMAMERAQHSEQLAFQSTVAANYAWAAEIAHDVNREIGHIRNWAFLIKETSQENSIHGDYADKIEESAAILSGGPWINPPKQNIPFDQVIKNSVDQVQIRKDITLNWDLQCEGQYVHANTLTFNRILKHLIRNASDGLRKITQEKKIIIRTRKLKNKLVELQVEDNGPGVSEEARPYIFQRQYSTKGQEGGVGLLIVRQMVEELGGKIRLLHQEPNRGAIFSIKLPSSEDPYNQKKV
jgi:signal transduction histidine kinase